jgi:hypothetical protein
MPRKREQDENIEWVRLELALDFSRYLQTLNPAVREGTSALYRRGSAALRTTEIRKSVRKLRMGDRHRMNVVFRQAVLAEQGAVVPSVHASHIDRPKGCYQRNPKAAVGAQRPDNGEPSRSAEPGRTAGPSLPAPDRLMRRGNVGAKWHHSNRSKESIGWANGFLPNGPIPQGGLRPRPMPSDFETGQHRFID